MKKIITKFFTALIFILMFVVILNGQTPDTSKSIEKQNGKNEVQDKPLNIKSKPRPGLLNCSQSSGFVTLRVTFDKSAKITNVEIVSPSGCDSFDKKAVKAAKRIKFTPVIKNGEAITVTKQVQYTFTKY